MPDVIQRLVSLGVRLAVDDFGTGYSSLSYLHRLSIDTLKVDRSFVEQIPGNSNSEAIAKAIIGLGKSLQLTVVAEGIENEAQSDFVSRLGCDYLQGFLFSKPVTAEAFGQLLETDCNRSVKFVIDKKR
jgi:EAL domain-containing protein (putative c-di-GMP-specific phosphodiesterase class I)